MLDDRDYMRSESRFGRSVVFRWSATTVLMAVIIGCFVVQNLIPKNEVDKYLALSAGGLKAGFVWQLLTYQFLHGGPGHLIFNLLALWSFGRVVEHRLGVSRFLAMYFLTGIIGGLFQTILAFLVPDQHGGFLCGASAGICGVMAVFCLMEPEVKICPLFMKARYALLVFIGVAVVFTIVPMGPRISHAAHLGGLLGGVAWVKLGWHHNFVTLPWEGLFGRLRRMGPLQTRQRKQELVRAAPVQGRRWRANSGQGEPETAPEEFISKEVDPILDKISAHGLQSLTDQERKVLDAARKKMSKP
ncbi:MAG: rhomboid family intramembrane serine protease [Verrucomicrobiota bacterium]